MITYSTLSMILGVDYDGSLHLMPLGWMLNSGIICQRGEGVLFPKAADSIPRTDGIVATQMRVQNDNLPFG
jgi:hypothetical protein